VKVVVYVEGGGDKRKTLDDCRRGFGQLFEKVVPTLHRPKIIACGGRGSAFHDFQRDVSQGREGFLILLVDSEGPVSANVTSWGTSAPGKMTSWTNRQELRRNKHTLWSNVWSLGSWRTARR
jgi:hypothetical protein